MGSRGQNCTVHIRILRMSEGRMKYITGCAPDEFDRNEWTLMGEPETTIVVNRPATVELTCANLVNRIPALLQSPAGYYTTEKVPNNVYLSKPMNEYIR